MKMAKLSPAMVKGLRCVANDSDGLVPPRTLAALERRSLITGCEDNGYRITPDGAYALVRIEHEEREAARQAEDAPEVPAESVSPDAHRECADSHYGDPCPKVSPASEVPASGVDAGPAGLIPAESVRRGDRSGLDIARLGLAEELRGMTPAEVEALVQECERDGDARGAALIREVVSAPAVPQAWIDQLVTILDAGVRITRDTDGRWWPEHLAGMSPSRVNAAVREAIRLRIASPGGDRLALTETFRRERAARRGIVVGAVVVFRPPLGGARVGNHRWEVVSAEGGEVHVASLSNGRRAWWPVERAELADRHEYTNSYSGMVCGSLISDAAGCGMECPHPADHPIHR